MRNEKIELDVRVPGRPLPEVLRELVAKLITDDWSRFSPQDGGSFYYVVGAQAHIESLSGKTKFTVVEFPRPIEPTPVGESYVRSQTASKHPDYLQRARRRLERLGGPSAVLDKYIEKYAEGEFDLAGWQWKSSVSIQERSEALLQLMGALALRVEAEGTHTLDDTEIREVEMAREKMYLQQLTEKYAKMVDRGARLEPISFQDPQLEEASRCYLYGFYRASIVLSAAAVEMHLKRSLGKREDSFHKFNDLVAEAESNNKLTRDLSGSAIEISRIRNPVAHAGSESDHDNAILILGLAKEVIHHLQSAQ